MMTTEIRKCKNPKCSEQFEIDTTNKHSIRRVYHSVPCKNEHYRATHREYYRIMSQKNNLDKLNNPKYAEICGRIRYVSKEERERREHAKILKELRESFMDTESSDQGAYL